VHDAHETARAALLPVPSRSIPEHAPRLVGELNDAGRRVPNMGLARPPDLNAAARVGAC